MKYKLGAIGAIKMLDMIMSTCQVRTHGLDYFIYTVKSKSTLFTLWHNRLALTPFAIAPYLENTKKIYAAISKSSDGNWVQAVMDYYPNTESIRIAHNRRPTAFQSIISAMKDRSMLIITPDGPKGPCYSAKPGVLVAAKETGSPILPFTWKGPHFEIDSWDKFWIPKPFSKIDIYFGKPIFLTPKTTLEEDKLLIEKSLN